MNKKIITIYAMILLIGTAFSSVGMNSKINNCIDNVDKQSELNINDLKNPPSIISDFELLTEEPNSYEITLVDLPGYFNWRDYNGSDWTTPSKDQGSCGSCWDFAAIGALESIIQIREECPNLSLDLSEQYVLSCLSHSGSCKGGSAHSAYKFIKRNDTYGNYCNGIIPEICFPYQTQDSIPCTNISQNWQDFLIPISDYGYWYADGTIESRNIIKTRILEKGPVVATMLFTIWNHGPDNLEEWGYNHHNPMDYYPYPEPIQGTNHQVVIVGWKDDSSITNGGYWIVKNSLSEEWGYNGFFNIEYGSLNIENSQIVWVDYNPENYSNWIPIAKINGPTQGNTNQELIFNGSKSIDHEGTIILYSWDFGDGTSQIGQKVTHTYTQQGIYQLTLYVTDNENNTNSENMWVYIDKENHPPQTPTITGKKQEKNQTIYIFTFSTNDPDGDDVEYYINWGDDYWFGGSTGWIGPYPSDEEITLEKTYKEKGNYTVRIKAQDKYGVKSDWSTFEVKMPKTYIYNKIINLIFKKLEYFPLLEQIINQTLI